MKVQRYKDCTYEELMEVEKKIYKEMRWLDKGKYQSRFPYWDEYKPGAEMLNNTWSKPTFWHIPEKYVKIRKEGEFPGEYRFPIHVRHNEELKEHFNKKIFVDRVNDLLKELRLSLHKKESKIHKEVEKLNSEFGKKLDHLRTYLIIHIEKNAIKVNKYEPHFSGSEDGRNTRKMIELIEDARFTFRGIVCGNIYTYEWLLGNYVNEEVIDDLWETTCKILEASKEYLAVQMALEHHKSNAGAQKKATDKELIPLIEKCIKDENIEVYGKLYSFLTKRDRKVKHTPIAQYIYYETEIFNKYDDYRILVDRVKKILPEIEGLREKEGNYFKK